MGIGEARPIGTLLLAGALLASACSGTSEPVSVASVATDTTTGSGPAEHAFEAVFESAQGSVARIDSSGCGDIGVGSGFVVGDGLVATAAHVVHNALEISVSLNGADYNATVLGLDSASDFAVLWVQGLSAPSLVIASDSPRIGSEIAAMGFPLGLPLSMSVGNVSAIDFELEPGSAVTFIQTDTAVNPGNSGGPLLSQTGEVVGIVDWQISDSQGLGFAIDTRTFLPQLEEWTGAPRESFALECNPKPAESAEPVDREAPGLQLPQAPWAGEAVSPPNEVAVAAEAWADARENGFGMDCALYAPTGLGEGVGMEAHQLSPVFTRVGDFQFGFQDPGGFQDDVWISLWPLDAGAIRPYFELDPDGTEHSDGSVTRVRRDVGGLGRMLIAIPGEDCFYELGFEHSSMVVRETMFATFRQIK